MSNLRVKFTENGTIAYEAKIERTYDTEIFSASEHRFIIRKTGYPSKERNDGLITIYNKRNTIVGYGLQECKREASYPNIKIRHTIIRRAFIQLMKYFYNEIKYKHRTRESFKLFIIDTESIIIPIYYKDIEPYIDNIFDFIKLAFTNKASRLFVYEPLIDYIRELESNTDFMEKIYKDAEYIKDDFNMKTFIKKIENKL